MNGAETGPRRSLRERRLADELKTLTGALDASYRELDEIAAEVRRAWRDLERARRSTAWRLAHRAGRLARVATLGRSNLDLDDVSASVDVLSSLDVGLIGKPGTGRPGGKGSRLRITVVSWDMGHNGVIRAHYLADLLSRRYQVQHIGPLFPQLGSVIWEPIRASQLPMRTLPGCELPAFVDEVERFLHGLQTDLIYVCKARFPSLLIGMVLKHLVGAPVIVDVDESELGFVGATGGISLDELEACQGSKDFANPYGRPWTQAAHGLVGDADAVVVASEVLEPIYGGAVVPHVRNERTFDPARFDRHAVRAELGYTPEDRVVLFAGTANRHKGVLEVARALAEMGDPRVKLCIAGSLADPMMRTELAQLAADRIQLLDFQAVSEIPRLTVIADLMCLPQNPASGIAQYQTPAKLTEALAMEVPVLAYRSPPLERFIDDGLIHPIGEQPLAERIRELFGDEEPLRETARRGREFFLERMSYSAGAETLDAIIAELRGSTSEVGAGWSRAYEIARGVGTEARAAPARQRRTRIAGPSRWDVVFFFRLSYSSVYGRRPDMLIKYMAKSERTRRLLLFDAPTDWAWIDGRRKLARRGVNHFELIARRAQRRAFVASRQGKLSSYMFVAQQPKDPPRWQQLLLPTAEEYVGYVERAVARDGIGKGCPVVLWSWPPTEGFEQVHAALSPDLTVADIIDDERKFFAPGSPRHEQVTRHHQSLFSYTDLVITHNVPLQERLRMFGVDAQLVLNATELFGATEGGISSRPRELRGLRGPIIGYSGTFSWRFDIELVDRLARERPDCQIVIVGSAHGAEDVLVLSRHPNVHFLGVKTYPDVTRYIRCFDVAIIPHINDALSRSMNPLKAYLYASCGVPSVATDIANLADLGEAIRVTHSDDEFIAAVSETLELRRQGRLSLDPAALLAGETWEDRVSQIEALIDDAFERRDVPLAAAA